MKIKTFSLTDFRAFPGPAPAIFELDGKNLLVYGENGSGKSSLFHALQGFFNPVSSGDIAKHKNVFTGPAGGVCEVRVEFDDGTTSSWTGTTVVTVPMQKASDVQGARLRAAVLDYRSILDTNYANTLIGERMKTAEGTYRYTAPTAGVNLFSVAVNTLLAGFRVANPSGSGVSQTTIGNLWTGVQSRVFLLPSSNKGILAPLENARVAFNAGMNAALQAINPLLQRLLNDLGHADLELMPLTFGGLTPNCERLRAKRYFEGQVLSLNVRFRTHPTAAPHSFLNEARLSALGLAIYLASRLAMVPQTTPDTLKLLVLDDVLIGLDQANRIPVLDVLEKHFRDWQIVLLTHDRLWFETARARAKLNGGWNVIELFANAEADAIYRPTIAQRERDVIEDYLNRATVHLGNSDWRAAAVYARSAFEMWLKVQCAVQSVPIQFSLEPRKLDSNVYFSAIEKWADNNHAKPAYDGVLKVLALYRDTVFNPGSHSYPTAMSGGEQRAAIAAMRFVNGATKHGANALQIATSLIAKPGVLPEELALAAGFLRVVFMCRLRELANRKNLALPFTMAPHEIGPADLWAAMCTAGWPPKRNVWVAGINANRTVLLDKWTWSTLLQLTAAQLTNALRALKQH